ncbi:MAG: hypothetical protein HZB53_02770 [Chloroflexi bacterium]|nr:hypothetical protein [Chloroflexota bacterium]
MADLTTTIVVIVAIALAGLIFLLWRNRFRINKIVLGAAPSVELERETDKPAASTPAPSVRIRNVDMRGANEMDVSRDGVDISDVNMDGANKLNVDETGTDTSQSQGPQRP